MVYKTIHLVTCRIFLSTYSMTFTLLVGVLSNDTRKYLHTISYIYSFPSFSLTYRCTIRNERMKAFLTSHFYGWLFILFSSFNLSSHQHSPKCNVLFDAILPCCNCKYFDSNLCQYQVTKFLSLINAVCYFL